jgi:serine/threonine protein phosphatase PrpC
MIRFELIDSLSLPGHAERANDDAFAFADNAAVVLDGATGLRDPLMPGKSDAAWLARFGANRLMARIRERCSAKESVRHALEDAEMSFKALRRREPKETYEMPLASMMFVVADEDRLEALWFGDCAALIKQGNEPTEVVGDAIEKREFEAARVAKLAEKHKLSPAAGFNRPEYLAALRRARNRVNTETGYWLFGPDARAADHVAAKSFSVAPGSLVLLATDGFLALISDYRRYTADTLIDAANTGGLKALGEELRQIEANDSEGRKYPRFKTSDDATALLLRAA